MLSCQPLIDARSHLVTSSRLFFSVSSVTNGQVVEHVVTEVGQQEGVGLDALVLQQVRVGGGKGEGGVELTVTDRRGVEAVGPVGDGRLRRCCSS